MLKIIRAIRDYILDRLSATRDRQLAKYRRQINQLRASVRTAKARIDYLEKQIAIMEAAIETKDDVSRSLQATIDNLEATIVQRNHDLKWCVEADASRHAMLERITKLATAQGVIAHAQSNGAAQ